MLPQQLTAVIGGVGGVGGGVLAERGAGLSNSISFQTLTDTAWGSGYTSEWCDVW